MCLDSIHHSHKNGKIFWKTRAVFPHFAQLCCTFMGGRYLKACRKTKKDSFLYEDDLDAILVIIDADVFENDEDMESEIVTCIKNQPSGENFSFKCKFCPKVCLSKAGLSRHEKAKHQ